MDSNAGGSGLETRALERTLVARLIVANTIAGVVVTTYFALAATPTPDVSRVQNLAYTTIAFLTFNLILSVLAIGRAKRLLMPAVQWLDDKRSPTAAERLSVLGLPRRIALFPLPYWVAAAVLTALQQVLLASDPKPLFTIVGILEGGLFACAMGFLLAERVLRPLLAIVLQAGDAHRGPPVGVGARLLLAWLLGSGIPLLGIATTPLIAADAELPVTVPMIFLATVAFFGGFMLTGAAARSIGEPMRDLRLALERVATGDLTTTLSVDNAGEMGQLQRGFNEMAAGLREREQLADLFGRHVGSDVAQRALDEGASLGGEVRTVSALFVDIIGSTTMARERSASDVVAVLNEFFAVVVSCVDAEGGWVNKFEGDGALCVFGAPIEQADHATRALRAARHIARALRDIDAGIGVSSGEAVAGNVGAEQRLEYTVIGPPVNEAARLSDAAKSRPRRVLASRAAFETAGDEGGQWQDAGTVSLRGLAPDFPVCEPRS
ncbi:MAG: adenylate cyclase [Acidimicrobiaceae bacterium]|jgi:adenylate cyclase